MRLPVLFRSNPENDVQDCLMAHADALISGSPDMDQLLAAYDRSIQRQAEELMGLAEQVNHWLIPVVPSDQFVNQLYRQIMETNAPGRISLWARIRNLPPRTQLAAGLGGAAMTAGVVYIASRSMPNPLEYWRNRRVDVA